MRDIFIPIAAVVVSALAACTADVEDNFAAGGSVKRPFELQADVSGTRTVAEGMSTDWEAGDMIDVWFADGGACTSAGGFVIDEQGLDRGIFRGEVDSSYDESAICDWYAAYPYAATNESPAAVVTVVGANIQRQNGYGSTSHLSGAAAPLYGVARDVAAGAYPSMSMCHLTTLVRVRLTNLGESSLVVRSITLQTRTTPVAGRFTVDITGDAPAYTPASSASKTALLRVSGGGDIDSGSTADFYLAVAPFVVPAGGEKLSLTVEAADGAACTRTFTIPAGAEFAPGVMNTLNLKFEPESIVDLSAEGTANCYIVTSGGRYRFTATTGNAGDRPEGMATADWLWMSESGDLISNVVYADGTVYFTAGEKRGNAVIAGFSNKDAIVWSWHIWLTDDPRETLHCGMTADWQLLDRNLGATSCEVDDYRSYGLYYQWGRKDPFVGPRHSGTKVKREENPAFTTSSATADYVVNPLYSRDFVLSRNINVTSGDEMAWVTRNPMTFVYFYADNNGSGQNWWNSGYANFTGLWGFVSDKKPVAKTIYDPCPYGYSVPNFAGTVYAGITADNLPVVSGSGLGGRMFTGAGGSSYYPAAGQRDYTGGYLSYMGQTGVYWTACTYPQGLNFRGLKFEGATLNTNVKLSATYGFPVRCVKEN